MKSLRTVLAQRLDVGQFINLYWDDGSLAFPTQVLNLRIIEQDLLGQWFRGEMECRHRIDSSIRILNSFLIK